MIQGTRRECEAETFGNVISSDKKDIARRISSVTEQIQRWGQQAYEKAKETPEFLAHKEPLDSIRRVRIADCQLQECTIVVPKGIHNSDYSIRLRNYRLGPSSRFNAFDLGIDENNGIIVRPVKRGHYLDAQQLPSSVKKIVTKRIYQIFEREFLKVSFERQIYSENSSMDSKTNWQTLKTETIHLV